MNNKIIINNIFDFLKEIFTNETKLKIIRVYVLFIALLEITILIDLHLYFKFFIRGELISNMLFVLEIITIIINVMLYIGINLRLCQICSFVTGVCVCDARYILFDKSGNFTLNLTVIFTIGGVYFVQNDEVVSTLKTHYSSDANYMWSGFIFEHRLFIFFQEVNFSILFKRVDEHKIDDTLIYQIIDFFVIEGLCKERGIEKAQRISKGEMCLQFQA
uniref:Uncharacterized protein n=1 Tax=Phalansterium sp. PJK-2012 TaxID=1267188 RepID=T1QE00_9EUKA|nr:hypothetical protein [Phalansterium sp. PJK-2012]